MEQKLYDAASKLPETGLDFSAIRPTPKSKPSNRTWRAIASIAACIALLLCVGFGTYAAEAKEYEAAVTFFAEHDLSVEGLTRGQIKAVYRDITTQTFSYEKTAEVILSSKLVEGYEIQQAALTGEELENIWNSRGQTGGVRYQVLTCENPSGYRFQKYDGETLLWSVDCSEYSYPGYLVVSDGVLVYGYHLKDRQALISKYDLDGNLLWRNQPDNGFEREQICAVLENEDGSYVAISSGYADANHVCVSLYTADGQRSLYKTTEMKGAPMDIAHLGDGYLVQLGSGAVIKMDRQGNVLEAYRYESDEWEYCWIQDMIEFDGKIYLSVYVTPKLKAGEKTYGRGEIARVLQYIYENKGYTPEELAAAVRENYTALLLVCDPVSGEPREFYSVPGSLGGSLEIDEAGCLAWEVHNITTAKYSPMTSAYSLLGTCYVHRYTFGLSGQLLYRHDTGKFSGFAR